MKFLLYPLYFLLIVPPIAIFISIIYCKVKIKLIHRLVYTREFSEHGVFEGDSIEIIETIYNPSFLPVFYVDVESYIYGGLKLDNHSDVDDMQLIISRFHLSPFTRITRRHSVKCIKRGYYTMNSASVLTRSIGIDDTKFFEFSAELYVYPKLAEHHQPSQPVNYIYGSDVSLRQVMLDPFSVAGIRDYTGSEPFNMINFKATAKSVFQGIQSIKVNKYDCCSNRVFMLYLNFQTPEDGMSTHDYEYLMEQSLSISASFITEALRSGYKAGLAANCCMMNGEKSLIFPIEGGMYHTEEILRQMAMAQARCGVSFTSLLDKDVKQFVSGAELFILTPYVDETMDENISALKRNNNVTVIKL